jgi:hypothetical protein
MFMRKLLLAGVLTVLVSAPSSLIGQVNIGAQLSWGDRFDLGFGGRITGRSPWLDEGIEFVGAFDLFFPDAGNVDDRSYWEVNLNLLYNISIGDELFLPYAGFGMNIARLSKTQLGVTTSATDVGANLLGGLKIVTGAVSPYGELRYEWGGGEQFVLTAGILFTVGAGAN